ncbi:hypothetical protein [uncultured Thiodictyon sp.]|uniref:hypothetical protein n=1 Tax=uncultured Thiodictyon sp. TaxID=1846217 RepID=UPI0025CCBE48|nr:hypothetical protein [uncultured Thiodictyon sp.]
MQKPVLVTACLTLTALLGGCGSALPGHIGGIVTYVSPDDYAERLCRGVDMESYPACASQVLDYFDVPLAETMPRGHSSSGPFAVAMEGALYLGTYQSNLFAGHFRVVSGSNACRGSYSITRGSRAPLYDVYCEDGRAGWAETIRDQTGANGIGQLTLSDGTKGDIVFGYLPLGRAKPYPWGDVWTPKAGPQTPPQSDSSFQ